jgi:hypothetical protein
MAQENIVDPNKPNAGRIYDYILGGRHNFEVDRIAAENLCKMVPFFREGSRLQRWCLKDIAQELTEKRGFDIIIDFASGLPTNDHIHQVVRGALGDDLVNVVVRGFDIIIDFASGLPTNDHIHQVVPKGTTVIYSDLDLVTVEYAREILKDTPNTYMFQGDVAHPEILLNRPEVQSILKGRRNVAFIAWGVSAYLSDEAIANAAKYLAEWSSPESCLAFNAQSCDIEVDEKLAAALKLYKQSGSPVYIRTKAEYLELLQPWHPDSMGFVSLLEWNGFDESILPEYTRQQTAGKGGNFGTYLVK